MIHLRRDRLLMALSVMWTLSLSGQTRYALVKPETIQQRLDLYKGDDTTREAALLKIFTQAGCLTANLSEQPVPHRKQPNIICVLPGSTPDVIVVGAHFDHVSAGDGIVDNWSGASLLPSLFQSLAGSPRKHTFVFVAFTGEEEGLRGSSFYVKQLAKDQLSKIQAMINLDTLGLGPAEVWVSQSDPLLVNVLALVARPLGIHISGMNVNGFGVSDEESFIREKICTITVHSVTPQTAHMLHSRDDKLAAIRFQDYYDTYRLLAPYLAGLDTVEPPAGHRCQVKPL
jgi:hypothetical protein